MTSQTSSNISSQLLQSIQAKLARGAIGASSMRGAGSKGVVEAVRTSLAKVSLNDFGTADASAFRDALDAATEDIVQGLPKQARHWGLARKGLNIFLRDCLYTVYLREPFSLHRGERLFEVPLDSITGKRLYEESGGRLPRWASVRGLNMNLSDRFQAEASGLADKRRIARVHLDAIWWGERLDESKG
ncbi:MAG TPA: hypothetical protein VNJ03_09650 [Vicinamibacterales bacterium]|nr:hypothetical protein [Vicinamibacterales bacterium]